MKPLALLFGALVATSAMAQTGTASGAPADVPRDHWAFSAVDNLFKAGILKGYPDGTFKGSRPATRFEMAGMLNGFYGGSMKLLNTLQERIDDHKSFAEPDLAMKSDIADLRSRLDSIRLQVAEMRRQREDIDSLDSTFKRLHDQLAKLHRDMEQMHQNLGNVNSRVKGR